MLVIFYWAELSMLNMLLLLNKTLILSQSRQKKIQNVVQMSWNTYTSQLTGH